MEISLFFIVTLCAFLLHIVFGGSILGGIPTKQEQVTVLDNVQEIFNYGTNVVYEEQKCTLKSVISDAEKMVRRAQETLMLFEELSIMKLTCQKTENSVQTDEESQSIIQKTIQEGFALLEQCTETISREIMVNSNTVSDVTSAATSHAQVLIDTLSNCTRKPALQQISCYRRVMLNDVTPVKIIILSSMDTHKKGHLKSIDIRNFANDCVDTIMQTYQEKVLNSLAKIVH